MEIILQKGLPHQQKAIDAVCSVLEGVEITPATQFYDCLLYTSRINHTDVLPVATPCTKIIQSIWNPVDCRLLHSVSSLQRTLQKRIIFYKNMIIFDIPYSQQKSKK